MARAICQKFLRQKNAVFHCFFSPRPSFPKNVKIWIPFFCVLVNEKNGYRPSKASFGFSKMDFFSWFWHFLQFFYIWTGFTVPSLLKMPYLVPIHHIYTYTFHLLSSKWFLSLRNPKNLKNSWLSAIFELLQVHKRYRLHVWWWKKGELEFIFIMDNDYLAIQAA